MGTWGIMPNSRRSIRTKSAKPDPFKKTTLAGMKHKMSGRRIPLEVQKAIKKFYPNIAKNKIKGVFAKGVANKTLKFRKKFYQQLGLRRVEELKAEEIVNTTYLSPGKKRAMEHKLKRVKRARIKSGQRSQELTSRRDGDKALSQAKTRGNDSVRADLIKRMEGARVSASQTTHTDKESINRSSANTTGTEKSVTGGSNPLTKTDANRKSAPSRMPGISGALK